MNTFIAILDKYFPFIQQILRLNFEVGGYISDVSNEMIVSTQGKPETPILNVVHYPFHSSIGKIDWHSHYNSIYPTDGLPFDAPRLIPSDTDVLSLVRSSLQFGYPCVSVVLSKWGYFFIFVSTKLLEKLDNGQLTLKRIQEKIEYSNHDYFIRYRSKSLDKRIERYCKSLNQLGIGCQMVFRYF